MWVKGSMGANGVKLRRIPPLRHRLQRLHFREGFERAGVRAEPPRHGAAGARTYSPAPAVFGDPHLRHCVFFAYWRSLQAVQTQSPGRKS